MQGNHTRWPRTLRAASFYIFIRFMFRNIFLKCEISHRMQGRRVKASENGSQLGTLPHACAHRGPPAMLLMCGGSSPAVWPTLAFVSHSLHLTQCSPFMINWSSGHSLLTRQKTGVNSNELSCFVWSFQTFCDSEDFGSLLTKSFLWNP